MGVEGRPGWNGQEGKGVGVSACFCPCPLVGSRIIYCRGVVVCHSLLLRVFKYFLALLGVCRIWYVGVLSTGGENMIMILKQLHPVQLFRSWGSGSRYIRQERLTRRFSGLLPGSFIIDTSRAHGRRTRAINHRFTNMFENPFGCCSVGW